MSNSLDHIDKILLDPTIIGAHTYQELSAHLGRLAETYYALNPSSMTGTITSQRSIEPTKDIDDFFEILADVLDRQQDVEKRPEADRIKIREDHSDLNFQGLVITWQMIQRRPGSFSQGKPGNTRIQQLSARLVSSEPDPVYPGHVLNWYAQDFDNLIQLTVWSESARTANRAARWLEDVLEAYKWYFVYKGIKHMFFEEQSRDMVRGVNTQIQGRPLIYRIITTKVTPVRAATLKEIVIKMRGISTPTLEE